MNDNVLHRIIDLAFYVKEHSPLGNIDMLGVDANTTAEELDNIEKWLFGLNRFQLDTLFATLEAFPAYGVEELSERVDDILDGRWAVFDKIRTPAELGYWLAHECSEYAETGDDLDDPVALRQAKELLADGAHRQTGALVPGRGYVSFSER